MSKYANFKVEETDYKKLETNNKPKNKSSEKNKYFDNL